MILPQFNQFFRWQNFFYSDDSPASPFIVGFRLRGGLLQLLVTFVLHPDVLIPQIRLLCNETGHYPDALFILQNL